MYEQLGGEAKLRVIISDFVDAVSADLMIGFLFASTSLKRLKEFEYQHAAVLLGAPDVVYRGRDLEVVHGPLRIASGQFSRRLSILRDILYKHRVSLPICTVWLAHQEALRHKIVAGSC